MIEQKGRNVTSAQAADILKKSRDVLILSHASPDGDTCGAAFALRHALYLLGTSARIECSDKFPQKFGFTAAGTGNSKFEPSFITAVDIADERLLGDKLSGYAGRIDLCIDHHPSNTLYAKNTFLSPVSAATCEIMTEIIPMLGVEIDKYIATCLYTGMATDTGCFKYSNTTPATLRCAADMMEKGADSASINKRLFDTVSKSRLCLEQLMCGSLEYYSGGKVAIAIQSLDMIEKSGAAEEETEGLASLPIRVEGVMAGITIKEKEKKIYKISVRTCEGINASDICQEFGGGGHAAAAGCLIKGPLAEVKQNILSVVERAVEKS